MNTILSSVTAVNNVQHQQQPVALADRADIHKSCKSLETLLNILNDYCEAATTIVALQKKLAKALGDTARLEVTNEIARNALNTSASIFEALAEVDAKFAKIADKEYDAISAEVKKWFKKLTKDEKAHDERIATANAKIKQAGLNFEKKSKKKALDAQEEHSRYIQLISSLGPEITQEKYNHSLQTTRKHTTITYNVAACLSRIADAEWLRTCESVKKSARMIGTLGKWRSLCEGGWVEEVPRDLIDLDDKGANDKLTLNTIQERAEPEDEEEEEEDNRQRPPQPQQQQVYENIPPPTYQRSDGEPTTPQSQYDHMNRHHRTQRAEPAMSREATSAPTTPTSAARSPKTHSPRDSPTLQRQLPDPTHAGTTSLSPPTPTPPSSADRSAQLRAPIPQNTRSRDGSPNGYDRERPLVDPNTGSVRSLSAFPAPPTHFPLPPPRRPSVQTPTTVMESRDEHMYTPRERLSESPLPLEAEERREQPTNQGLALPPQGNGDRPIPRRRSNSAIDVFHHSLAPGPSNSVGSTSPAPPRLSPLLRDPNHDGNEVEYRLQEFGALGEKSAVGKARTLGAAPSPGGESGIEFPSSIANQKRGLLERTDTGGSGSGSIVAAMKSRYGNASGSRSPPPHVDLPRLHTSVSEMATRYQPPAAGPPMASATGNGREIGHGEQESPKAFLRPASKSPPPMTRHISLPPAPDAIEPRRASLSMTPTPSAPAGRGVTTAGAGDVSEDGSRWRRLEEFAEMGIRAKEKELREREQEIATRERELERDRARLVDHRESVVPPSPGVPDHKRGDEPANPQGSQFQIRPRERRISLRLLRGESQTQQRQEQLQPPQSTSQAHLLPSSSSPNLRHQSHHSYSSTNNLNQDFPSSSTSGSGSGGSTYLGQSTNSSAPPPNSQEKKGGWMRRLSMPVGNAFSLDSSKRSMNNSGASTASSTSMASGAGVKQLGAGLVGGKGVGMDERKNMSSTALGLGQHQEYQMQQQYQQQDGGRLGLGLGIGRRSHDASRSATNLSQNLGLGGRK